jgi:hypothetical protein
MASGEERAGMEGMHQGRLLGRIVWLFIPLAVLTMVAGYLSYRSEARRIYAEAAEAGRRVVAMTESRVEPLVRDLAKDALYLARSQALQAHLDGRAGDSLAAMQSDWRSFVETRAIYDQLRWIDEAGMERVRINRSATGAEVVPEAALQFKGDRYYFTEAMKLRGGETFVSRLDLNVEGNAVELPWKPMIRFATPVADRAGRNRGVVVTNYLASDLLAALEPTRRSALWLTNRDGCAGPTPPRTGASCSAARN